MIRKKNNELVDRNNKRNQITYRLGIAMKELREKYGHRQSVMSREVDIQPQYHEKRSLINNILQPLRIEPYVQYSALCVILCII